MRAVVVTAEMEQALGLAEGKKPTPKELTGVAAVVGDEAARWAFGQWALRERARTKFARADEMIFTRDGLEMASHEAVAALHAELLGEGPYLDATCGVGTDSILLARKGETTACDTDPEHVVCARHNLAVHGVSADVQQADCLSLDWSGFAVMVDPQRRTSTGRTLDPASFSPPLDAVFARCRTARMAVVKLSPMLPDELLEQGDGLIFVSHRGECCEALVTFGTRASRWAAMVDSRAWIEARGYLNSVQEPGGFVHEADPATIRAHALGAFELDGLGDSNGYLTGDTALESPWLKSYRVIWAGAFHEDKLRDAVKASKAHVVAVKKRGVDIEPERLRKKLPVAGDRQAVVILYKSGKSVRAVLADRI